MATPSITGSITNIKSSSASGSQGITVPSDAKYVLVMTSYWESGAPTYTALTLGGDSISLIRKTTDSYEITSIHGRASPKTGSQTFAWTWASAPDEGAHIFVIFLKDVDTTSPVTGHASAQSAESTIESGSFSTSTEDLCLCVGAGYNVTAGNAGVSGQTEVADGGNFNSVYGLVGTKPGVSGTTTMSITWTGSGMANSICAVSIKYGAAGVTVTPAAATAIGSKVDPTVVLGSISITPATTSAIGSTVNPTVVYGSLSITPAATTAIGTTVNPTVVTGGGLSITPTASTAIGTTLGETFIIGYGKVGSSSIGAGLTVVLGSTSITPANVSAIGSAIDPTVVLGSTSVTPASVTAIGSTVDPSVIYGNLAITPAASSAIGTTVNPTVVYGSVVITPAVVTAIGTTADPAVVLGSTAATPAAITAVGTTLGETWIVGYGKVGSSSIGAGLTVVLGSLSITPANVSAIGSAIDPTVVLGSTSVTPASVTAIGTTVDPTVVLGSVSIAPSVITAIGSTVDPTVVIGGEAGVYNELFRPTFVRQLIPSGMFNI